MMTHARPCAFAIPVLLPPTLITPVSVCPRRSSRPRLTMMADISKPRPGVSGPKQGPSFGSDSGGGVAVITKPDTRQETKRKSKTEKEPSWRVLLHNDDVHTFDYVTGAIVKVRAIISFLVFIPLWPAHPTSTFASLISACPTSKGLRLATNANCRIVLTTSNRFLEIDRLMR